MNTPPTVVLLAEADVAEAKSLEAALADGSGGSGGFLVHRVTRLASALAYLARYPVDVVLLDLSLPDSQGMAAFEQVLRQVPEALILLLCSAEDEDVARQAVGNGAQDYLVRGRGDARWLPRALNYLKERKTIRDALRVSEARFRAISDASPLGIFVSGPDGSCVYSNVAYQKISGLAEAQALGTSWSSSVHPEDRSRVLEEWRKSLHGEAPFQSEFRFLQPDRSVVWTRVHSAVIGDGEPLLGRVQTIEDITLRKTVEAGLRLAEEALFEEKERAQVTLNSIGDAVLATDLQGHLTYLNGVAEEMTGWSGPDALGHPLAEVFHILDGETREPVENPAQRAIREDRIVGLATDCVLVRRDGTESAIEDSAAPIHDREGRVSGAVIVFHDVSESRFMALKMAHLAQHDFLTGLPNRLLLTERLRQAIGMAHRHGKQVALLFVDLDHFKRINDSLGHATGDLLLQSAAARLAAGVRATDTVCRQGGDEFVILLSEIVHPEDAAQIAEKLRATLAEPHVVASRSLHVTLSIGISVYPDDGGDVDTLMQNADTAMYHAKTCGRDNYQFFKAEMNTRALKRLALDNNLRRAMKHGEFALHYQPKVNLESGLMTGMEALIRWRDPELGIVLPLDFVPLAEESGLIVPIGRWVLREACRQVQAWRAAGLVAVPVAVNISALEFRQKDFLAGLAQILQETGLPPQDLELELTESVLMHDAESSSAVLKALKGMGVQLAIDDFGTGYSSLSYLKRFPIDTLKIDQSFVHDISADSDNATIVSAVIGMGRNLKQRVIAEGIETVEQLSFLKAQRCEEGQGFQFSAPLPAEEFARLLASTAERKNSGRRSPRPAGVVSGS